MDGKKVPRERQTGSEEGEATQINPAVRRFRGGGKAERKGLSLQDFRRRLGNGTLELEQAIYLGGDLQTGCSHDATAQGKRDQVGKTP